MLHARDVFALCALRQKRNASYMAHNMCARSAGAFAGKERLSVEVMQAGRAERRAEDEAGQVCAQQ